MRWLAFLLTLLGFVSNLSAQKIDDWKWEHNTTQEDRVTVSPHMGMVGAAAPAPMKMMKSATAANRTIGLSVGGAKDANNFYENIQRDYLPKLASLTYEGVFYDHYFDIAATAQQCEELFCPTYAKAITKDLYNGETNYYLNVGLDSGIHDFKRKKLNLVVVLDISGSMGSRFDAYYYDKKNHHHEEKRTKMEIANRSITHMMDHLKDDDRFGVVLFDNDAYEAKPLNLVKHTDMSAIKKHILDLRERGGTNWKSGYDKGVDLYKDLKFDSAYENRIIFLTDAMPNRGELSEQGLFGMVKKASQEGIHTTFVGIGVDFNNDLVEAVTKTKGANYYSVHSAKEFKKKLAEEFEFMVTPLLYDMQLRLQSDSYQIEAVYGSPEADQSTGELLTVSTLFPSAKNEEQVKGGVVLVKLKPLSKDDDIRLTLTYRDTEGKKYTKTKQIRFTTHHPFYQNSGIQKAILLSNYVDILRNWMVDERKACNDEITGPEPIILPPYPYFKQGLVYPPSRPEFRRLKTWERKSCTLQVSEGYKKILGLFARDFKGQKAQLGDSTLQKELDALNLLLKKKPKASTGKKDDWKLK
jgi:Ca-activated chloride channel family protein